jgi:ATP-dependent DNA ligase
VIACRDDGLVDFELLRYRRQDDAATLIVFDLLELDARDLRSELIEARKAELARLLSGPRPELVLNAVFEEPGRWCSNMHAARVRRHREQAARVALHRRPIGVLA